MKENNEQIKNVSNESSSKSKKSEKKEHKKSFFSDCKAEFKKITWPTKKVLTKQTITVIFISLIVGIIIFGYDLGINYIFQSIIKLMA